ncbi:MAG: hypothetical protein FWG82_04025 [Oscillospiraceae bacterium]|nr:hypothetical protein [Oscillospiraceae bacterium]
MKKSIRLLSTILAAVILLSSLLGIGASASIADLLDPTTPRFDASSAEIVVTSAHDFTGSEVDYPFFPEVIGGFGKVITFTVGFDTDPPFTWQPYGGYEWKVNGSVVATTKSFALTTEPGAMYTVEVTVNDVEIASNGAAKFENGSPVLAAYNKVFYTFILPSETSIGVVDAFDPSAFLVRPGPPMVSLDKVKLQDLTAVPAVLTADEIADIEDDYDAMAYLYRKALIALNALAAAPSKFGYYQSDWEPFEIARNNGVAVIANTSARVQDVEDAYDALLEAYGNLNAVTSTRSGIGAFFLMIWEGIRYALWDNFLAKFFNLFG